MAHIKELTSLRAFAALIVVLFHMYFKEGSEGFLHRMISNGHLGVDLFFILSGFILTYVYHSAWSNGSFSYRDFLTNRIARVYPLHLFVILLFLAAYQAAAILGRSGFEGADYQALPFHILGLHAWGFTDAHAWNFPSWSISAEFFAYLLFPLAILLMLRMPANVSLVVALLIFAATHALAASQGKALTKMMYDFGILRISGEFLVGIALCQLFLENKIPVKFARPGLLVVLLGILLGVYFQVNESIIVLMLAALIFCVALLSREERSNFLRHPALVYLGEISYATYMVHILVLMSARAILPASLTNILSLIIIYVCSVLLYHAVEVPARKFLRSLLKREKKHQKA
ncbi:acyltransferase [uncultured Roseibium sp.]|uniref:acyltransferase family protein n=1 Tax=uncultured Roseibium sp. TaxID=1936171 RepID=UPI0026106D8D|nr:acyltransferase [uncultured Roseibium sp.]